jgi:hypothetical protein
MIRFEDAHKDRLAAVTFCAVATIIWGTLVYAVIKATVLNTHAGVLDVIYGILFFAMFPALIVVMLFDHRQPSTTEILLRRAETERD